MANEVNGQNGLSDSPFFRRLAQANSNAQTKTPTINLMGVFWRSNFVYSATAKIQKSRKLSAGSAFSDRIDVVPVDTKIKQLMAGEIVQLFTSLANAVPCVDCADDVHLVSPLGFARFRVSL